MLPPAGIVTPSRLRTRLFPALFTVVALPATGLAAWFYIMSVGAVEAVLEQQTSSAVGVAAERVATTYRKLHSETALPARAGETVAWFAARDRSAEEAARLWDGDVRLFLGWFSENGGGLFVRVVYLDARGEPLVQYPPTGTASSGGAPTDARGMPPATDRLRVTVQRGTSTGTVIRFARPVRATRCQPSPGFVYVDAPLAALLPETRRGDVELAIADRASDSWLSVPRALSGHTPLQLGPLMATLAADDSIQTAYFSTDTRDYIASLVHHEDPAWSTLAVIRSDPYLAGPRLTGAITVGATVGFVVVAGGLLFALVRRVQQRTTDLELAIGRAEEATRNKSEFLSNMSHDLRTPMNAIIGYTRILLRRLKGAIEERQYGNLQSIQTSANNLLALINEILDLSRIEAGRIDLKPEPVDLGRLVGECIASVAPLAKPGVELLQELQDVPPINTDPDRIRRVVMNLLGNAVKFTQQGNVTVYLRPADSGVELAVIDTGVGIPAEDLPHIFEEFRQVERQVVEKAEGTGLGLAIAAKSVEMLGGTITADSAVGKGTTFTLRIGDYA